MYEIQAIGATFIFVAALCILTIVAAGLSYVCGVFIDPTTALWAVKAASVVCATSVVGVVLCVVVS